MRPLLLALALLLAPCLSRGADEDYPLRDVKDGEGRAGWWWSVFYPPVVIVRGSLAETQKDRPDIVIHAPYATWARLTDPSLANEPTEKGFFLLLTRFTVEEVLYVDSTLLHGHRDIRWLAERKEREFDCLLPAAVTQTGGPDEAQEGRYTYAYKLDLPDGAEAKPRQEYILVFQRAAMYPIDGLHLTAVISLDKLKQIRKICEFRTTRQRKP